MAFADVAAFGVANGVERQLFGVVVLVAFLFLDIAIDEGFLAVIEGVVAGIEGMPPSRPRGVLLCRTTFHRQDDGKDDDHISKPSHFFLFFASSIIQ